MSTTEEYLRRYLADPLNISGTSISYSLEFQTAPEFQTAGSWVNIQTGTNYQLSSNDFNKTIVCNNSSEIILTVPYGLAVGFVCSIIQLGTGRITITGSDIKIVNRKNYNKTAGQYALASLISPIANTFILSGDVGA